MDLIKKTECHLPSPFTQGKPATPKDPLIGTWAHVEKDPWFHCKAPFVKPLRQHGEAVKHGQTETGKANYDAKTPPYIRIGQSDVILHRSREAAPSARLRVQQEALTIAY